LGRRKRLKPFLEYIPAGLHNLHHAAANVVSLPHLLQLTLACQRVNDQT
jgi:hypothetical protein